jgi:membrane protein YdbS with pleckstrin-like domain
MKIVGKTLALLSAFLLLIVAVPYALVQLDYIEARRLHLVPSAMAITIALFVIWSVVLVGRKTRK